MNVSGRQQDILKGSGNASGMVRVDNDVRLLGPGRDHDDLVQEKFPVGQCMSIRQHKFGSW